ncbi:MAG: proton-conducting transporter membrane subunit [Candidatus Dormiibacterota bacterium]
MNLIAQTTPTTTGGVNFPTIVFTLMVWSALAFALATLAMPDQTGEQRSRIKTLGACGTGTALFFSLWAVQTQAADAAAQSGGGVPGGELVEQHNWLTSFPFTSGYHLDADGLALALALLGGVVFFCAALACWRNDRRVKLLTICLLVSETGFMGVLTAYDWVLFLLFWTLPVAPLYLLVRAFGHSQQARAATRYAAVTLVSGGLITLAATLIGVQSGGRSFDMGTVPVALPGLDNVLAFWVLAAAFLLAMAVVPLHGALLDLEEDSTGALAAIFGALLPSLGAYGLLHIAVGFFPAVAAQYTLLFAALAVVTVVWSGLGALRADDLRRQVGHAGNALMGLVLLGVAGHTTVSLTGAMYLLIARGLAVAVLMLLASGIQERTRRVRISQLGGLAWQAPHLAAFWGVGVLTAAGAPLLAGFFGYFSLFAGAFPAHRWATVVVLAATLLVTGVLLRTGQRIFMGGQREGFARVRDLGALELTYIGILAVVSLFMGVDPGHFSALFMNGAGNILFPGSSTT